jgi:hypothetical protein
MTNQIITEEVNIDVRPDAMEMADIAVTNVTIGDLHSNAIKLLFFLVRQGIVEISVEDYARLVKIYKTPPFLLTIELLDEFKLLIQGMNVLNRDILVRLIGDELADRGANDYYVLEILNKLMGEKVGVEILLSNHGAEFVESYERFAEKKNQFKVPHIGGFGSSLKALNNLVQWGFLDSQYIFNLIERCYKPTLQLLGYSLDSNTNGITLYSHAGIGLESIHRLAQKFDVPYNDGTSAEIAATIEAINKAFQISVQENKVHTLYTDRNIYNGFTGMMALREDNALEFIVWNRNYSQLERPANHNGYSINFVHGHDSGEPSRDNLVNLDDILGKAPHPHIGIYTVLVSDEKSFRPAEIEDTTVLKKQRKTSTNISFFANNSTNDLLMTISSEPSRLINNGS